jgi:hypothetical protein
MMEVEDFKQGFEDILGIGWQTKLAKTLEVQNSTVARWVSGAVPIPGYVRAYHEACCERQRARGAVVFLKQNITGKNSIPFLDVTDSGMLNMKSKLPFPGVESLKNFPSINHTDMRLEISGEKNDKVIEGHSYVLTRHPDQHHRDSYTRMAEYSGFSVAKARSRNHHYTLIVFYSCDHGEVTRQIATHSGVLRTTKSNLDNPREITEFSLADLV